MLPHIFRKARRTIGRRFEDVSQLFGQFEQPYDRAIQTHFKLLTDRRAAAIELALRLYRLDHWGHLPAALQELVPQYLPYVPFDPMAAGAADPVPTKGQTARDLQRWNRWDR